MLTDVRWIFVGCDIVSILMQAAGGGAAATEDSKLVVVGDHMIVAGIAFQLATQTICAVLAADYAFRTWKARKAEGRGVLDGERKGLKFYLICTTVGFLTIYIRCAYRIAEMSGGWGSPLMQKESEFMVLDGAYVIHDLDAILHVLTNF
jgi:hypothetical protein